MARRAEQRKCAKPQCKFHLFDCDGTCRLEPVESLLRAVEKKVDFKITIKKHSQNTAQLLKIIPELKMDYAVFVVHARDSRSFNEDSNGKIYNALKKKTGSDEKVLIVIGEDERYKNKDEEEKAFISHLGEREISLQVRRELMDGRKSFVFSWNKKHRPIHEEAMLHFLDTSKNGQAFVPKPKPQMENVKVAKKESETQPAGKKKETPVDDSEPSIDEPKENPSQDDRVLIVIGGDNYYKDEDEEDRSVISRWARRKVASQFDEEYLDGRKSFIFSWDTKHRPIHEEALRHYLDPNKKGVKFVYTPEPKPLPRPVEPEFIPPGASQDARQEPFLVEDDGELIKSSKETSTRRRSVSSDRAEQREGLRGDEEEASYGAIKKPDAGGTSVVYPADTILLETRLRYGKLSYQKEDVSIRKDKWQPADRQLTHLREEFQRTPEVQVRLISNGYVDVSYTVVHGIAT